MNFFSKLLIYFIKFYKIIVSPWLGNHCRYLPTCSEYFIECLETYGFFKGFIKGIKRVLSCHPIKFLGGSDGFDPVKGTKIKK